MTRSLGNKRKYIPENGDDIGIGFITKLYGDFEENEFCKIYPNEFFGYWRVTVEQPIKDEHGNIQTDSKGNPKPDTTLRDYENIPFLKIAKTHVRASQRGCMSLQKQTIEEYFDREVKPYAPGSWIDHSKTKTGYEINFTKYFYKFKPLRSLANIKTAVLSGLGKFQNIGKKPF
jgi:type I restriction enzyme M protein